VTFARWLRAESERSLMIAAERRIAEQHGLPPPPAPRGLDVFWQRVYVPVYHRLPLPLRTVAMKAMPGSHRRTWHRPEEAEGPAV
jgi:hypothetical protein